MENTCNELLDACLRGEAWPRDLLDRALAIDDGRAFLSTVVEGLNDRFEPRFVEIYERLFKQVIERVAPEIAIRKPGRSVAPPSVDRVYVLSRITLGADVAVTSVMLDAMKRRYRNAEIVFVGPRKSFEMFEADERISHRDAPYARGGSLAGRLRASASLWFDDGIVIDPDSRLTQLGLISVCDESRYFHFPSRSLPGGRLPEIASEWIGEIFGVESRPFVAPQPASDEPAEVTISLGVGENEAKRFLGDFECILMQKVAQKRVLVDLGGTPAERARVERAIVPGIQTHDGSFASFASQIIRSKLYIGYDSSGAHVASAAGVPVISIFTGALSDRFLERWKPLGTIVHNEREALRAIEVAISALA